MTDYISGEKHQALLKQTSSKSLLSKPLLIGLIGLVLVGVSFYGGIAYQKSRSPKTVTANTAAAGFAGRGGGFAGGGRGRFGGRRPASGQVTAVSSSSITVKDSSTGTDTTLSITGDTQISNDGQTAAASSIQVGDTVLIIASQTDKTQAARILVNPSFGGNGGGQQSSTGNTPTSTD